MNDSIKHTFLLALAALLCGVASGAPSANRYDTDFAAFLQEIENTYPFFELKGIRNNWQSLSQQLMQKARGCASDAEFLKLIVQAVECLRDAHMGIVESREKLPPPPPEYYPGISFLPASSNRVVVMYPPPGGDAALKTGALVTRINGREARAFLDERGQKAWQKGGCFSSPQRARLFEYCIPLHGAKGDRHTIIVVAGAGTKEIALSCQHEARGWPHTYNMPRNLTAAGRSCSFGKLASGVGYVYLRRVDDSIAPGLAKALAAHPDAKGWIVDLRGNGGGGYDDALLRQLKTIPRPVAALIDAGCISAGETLARDLVQLSGARLFGSRTAGASSSKRRWKFPSGIATLSLPVRSRFGPQGRCIEYHGIEPDEVVEAEPEELQRGLNSVILRAEKYLLQSAKPGAKVQDLIRQAGNAEDDTTQLQLLRQLQETPDLDPALKADAEKMAAFVERWLTEKSLWKWFDREIRKTLDYDFKIAKDSPLQPLACFYRGRMLVWVANEYGNILGYHETRRPFFDKAVAQFRIAATAFPQNRIARMYLGEPFPPARTYPNEPDAPRWAALQRECLERLGDVILWWIEHRLQPDGQYGGAWDDDCEMWRAWVPVMIAFEHPRITKAQAFFSDALLSQPYMKDGYTSHLYDVEHTAEPSSDTILPMMHLAPDDPAWKKRALRLAELMETLWTGVNQRGRLQFKSTYFNATRVDDNPKRACDTPYSTVAIPPALLLWQRTGDKKLGALFSRWMDTWVDAAAREEHGKPAGIIPAAIHWPDGVLKGPGDEWWDPRHHDEPRLYEWPSAVGHLMDALLLTWHMTGDEKYLRPVRSMAAARLRWLHEQPARAPAGSEVWCGGKLGVLAGTLAKYTLLSGNGEFDAILAKDDPGESIANRDRLAETLQATAEALRINFPAYTSEVRFTDRVFAFARLFKEDFMFPHAVPANAKQPNTRLLYATATGDRGEFSVFPLNAVRWLTLPQDIAALVTRSSTKSFEAELFHFGRQPRRMAAELYLLAPSRYTCEIRDAGGAPIAEPVPVAVKGPRTRIAFELPPRKLCVFRVVETKRERGQP